MQILLDQLNMLSKPILSQSNKIYFNQKQNDNLINSSVEFSGVDPLKDIVQLEFKPDQLDQLEFLTKRRILDLREEV